MSKKVFKKAQINMTAMIKEPTPSASPPTPTAQIKPPSQPTTKTTTKSTTKSKSKTLARIKSHPTLTPSRRRIYTTLLSIPPGHWTTYSLLAKYLNTSARAIGNAMRANPFAPDVPCHRVLAADGSLGGYKGEWVVDGCRLRDGSFGEEKRARLEAEGVEFDERGRAKGVAFCGFEG